MGWTPYQLFLVVLLVLTGTLNTLTTKWADKIKSPSSDGVLRPFNHPFTQSLFMFLGEMLCLLLYKILFFYYRRRSNEPVGNNEALDSNTLVGGNRNFRVSIFFIPAMCDMVATSLMYVGLTLTYASSFQMLRGSLIVFVALLSVGFLERKINSREWCGIFLILCGLAVVGVSDFVSNSTDKSSVKAVITGDLLIVLAQIITAVQMVCEEYFVSGQQVAPLQAVGWEGIFGFLVLALLHIPMYFLHIGHPFSNNPRGVVEDFPDAMVQISNNPLLVVSILGTITSIAFFNFAGVSVTKEISASTRTVLDSARTLLIWVISIALKWQDFAPIQILGFFLLVIGMFVYVDVGVTATFRAISDVYRRRNQDSGREILINQAADETQPSHVD